MLALYPVIEKLLYLVAAVALIIGVMIWPVIALWHALPIGDRLIAQETFGKVTIRTVKLRKPLADSDGFMRYIYETRAIGARWQQFSSTRGEALAAHYEACLMARSERLHLTESQARSKSGYR